MKYFKLIISGPAVSTTQVDGMGTREKIHTKLIISNNLTFSDMISGQALPTTQGESMEVQMIKAYMVRLSSKFMSIPEMLFFSNLGQQDCSIDCSTSKRRP